MQDSIYAYMCVVVVCLSAAGRFMIGFFQGAQMTLMRAYIGETSAAVISTMSPEKRHKSTLKYTNFFITFTVCSLSVMVGPGKRGIGNSRDRSSGVCMYIHEQIRWARMS